MKKVVLYRIKKMDSIRGNTHNSVWLGDFTKSGRDKFFRENDGVFVTETIVVCEHKGK